MFSSAVKLGAALLLASSATAASVTKTFSNNDIYKFDTDGNNIGLTNDKIDYLGGQYVWYGNSFDCGLSFCGIKSWSSPDLTTWKANGYMFDPNTTTIQTVCFESGDCGRPHIVYNNQTQKYVMWVNSGSPGYVTFTSSSPTSGYVMSASRALIGYQPTAHQGGDFSIAVINGTGYVAYSSIDFTTLGASIWPPFLQSIYVQQLTSDYLNTTGSAYHVAPLGDLVDYEAESPDIWKRGDYFYVTASNTCGFCTGTLLVVYRSKSYQGPWTRQIISGDTCGAQSCGVLTLPSPSGGPTTYLHQADVFSSSPITGIRTAAHGHRFQTLSFNSDGSLQELDCSTTGSTTATFVAGSGVSTTGRAVNATDYSSLTDPYTQICDLPMNSLYQTWSSSKTGTLSEVGVNIAGDSPTGNVTFTVFRYSNNTNFFTPRYTWETLSTLNVVPANITSGLNVVRIPVSAKVTKGDRLGVAIVSLGITPVCRLARQGADCFDINTSTRTLFYNGANQVSYRGADGKTPPVLVMAGQEIKWYATVV